MSILYKDGLSRLWMQILNTLNDKVDKVDNMGLSANDYTTEEKEKLKNMPVIVVSATQPTSPTPGMIWLELSK